MSRQAQVANRWRIPSWRQAGILLLVWLGLASPVAARSDPYVSQYLRATEPVVTLRPASAICTGRKSPLALAGRSP